MLVLPKTDFLIKGEGKIVLFLHGWGSNKESFNGVVKTLCNFYKCVCLDFWGFGRSETPNFVWSVDDYAEAVLMFLNKLKIEKCYVVAHSFGGRVAIKLLEKTNKIEKLVLVDSAGIRRKLNIFEKIKIKRFKKLKNMVNLGYKNPKCLEKFGSQDYKNLSGVMKKVFVKVVNEDLTENIKKIKIPTKLIWGKNDKQTPLKMAKQFFKYIDNSSLNIIKGGHFSFVDDEVNFCKICLQFWGEYD